jgi:hypothetical protein
MATNAIKLRQQGGDVPVAIKIGLGHTQEVTQIFDQNRIPYKVIRCRSADDAEKVYTLSTEAMSRKAKQQSVGEAGSLGALIDGRKAPSPVLNEIWTRVDLAVRNLMIAATRAAGEEGRSASTIMQAINTSLALVDGANGMITVSDVSVNDLNGVSLKLMLHQGAKVDEIWASCKSDPAATKLMGRNLDAALNLTLERLRSQGGEASNAGGQSSNSDQQNSVNVPNGAITAAPVRLTSDVIAVFGLRQEDVIGALRSQ